MRELFLEDAPTYEAGSIFDFCSNTTDGQPFSVMECVSSTVQTTQREAEADLRRWITVLCGALVFFMQAGFAMLCAGSVRKKNVQNTMLKNLLDACGAGLGFFILGYGFAFGGQNERTDITFIGTANFFNTGNVDEAFWFYEYAFSAACVTIVAGTLAERCQMAAYLSYSVFLTAFVYPVVAHAIWSNNGFLSIFSAEPFKGVGVIDFAGSGVVHLTGGTTSLIATKILGARKGRFYDTRGRPLDTPKPFPGHSVALQLVGTLILWFGWYGFNPGSALLLPNAVNSGQIAATAAVNTSLSAAAGAVFALSANVVWEERLTGEYSFNLAKAMNGALAGLVSITAGCGIFENYAALVTGIIGGGLYLVTSNLLIQFKLDDAVDAIPVHMVSGLWGLLAVGLFSEPDLQQAAFGIDQHAGLVYGGDGTLLGNQVLAILFIVGWTFFTMCPFFLFLNSMGWFRSDSLEELVGLDEIYHGGRHEGEEVLEEAALHTIVKSKVRTTT